MLHEPRTLVLLLLFMWAVYVVSVMAHEWGHYIVLRANKLRVVDVRIGSGRKMFTVRVRGVPWAFHLEPWGGHCAHYSNATQFLTHRQRLLLYGAGPGMNLMLVVAGVLLMGPFSTLAVINFFMFCVNLLPSDGDSDGDYIAKEVINNRATLARRRQRAAERAQEDARDARPR